MIRYVIAVFVALMVLNAIAPSLHKIGLGRLPGDLNFRWLGRNWHIPLTTTLVLSALISLIVKVLS